MVAARIWRSRSGVPRSMVSSSVRCFLGQFVYQGKLGHPAAFPGLAFPKLPEFALCWRHGSIIYSEIL